MEEVSQAICGEEQVAHTMLSFMGAHHEACKVSLWCFPDTLT